MARRTGMLGFLATLVAALMVLWAPLAIAHHKDGHESVPRSEEKTSEDEGTSNEIPDDNDDNAHPSGKDRETVNGSGDDAQGNSDSNPDNDGHGPERNSCEGSGVGECVDKAGGDGGVDTDDQDGNNGCGNDDDFEDDNEGWCGKPAGTEAETEVAGDVIVDQPTGGKPFDYPEVGGEVIEAEMPSTVAVVEDAVLGERITRGSEVAAAAVAPAAVAPAAEVEGAALPYTGGSLVQLLVTGLSLVALGAVSVLARK